MALPLPQGQERLPRIRHSRLHGLNKNILFVLSPLKETVIHDRLEAFLPVLHTWVLSGPTRLLNASSPPTFTSLAREPNRLLVSDIFSLSN